jgi:hypothetical protein
LGIAACWESIAIAAADCDLLCRKNTVLTMQHHLNDAAVAVEHSGSVWKRNAVRGLGPGSVPTP